jgi:putative ABC transport system substrate-binding protein
MTSVVDRRAFLAGTLGVFAAPLAVEGQVGKTPRIGVLAVGTREGRASLIEGFLQGLREHGYVVGQNIVIEYRFSEGKNDRLPGLAAELVKLQVDLILASGIPASFAAKDATRTIPIVMGSLAADPVETGLIVSLARPGGNITGMTEIAAQLGEKRLELLKETVSGLSRVAVFWNPLNPAYGPILRELEAAAPALGVELRRVEVRVPDDLEAAFQGAIKQRAGALVVPGDPLVTNRPRTVTDLALKYRLPTMFEHKEFAEAGASCLSA